MQVRNLLVAASAVAILAGTSVAAMAGSHSFSKGESVSVVHASAGFHYYSPDVDTFQFHKDTAIVKGSTDGEAASGGTTSAIAAAGSGFVEIHHIELGGSIAIAGGTTSGSACAGSGCNSNPNVGNPAP